METVIKKQGVWEGEGEGMGVVFGEGNKEAGSVASNEEGMGVVFGDGD